ncbi:DedA family protein [Pseudanabaena sp. FACHB-2040]|uniref:DedA family protein n=1 Tax=Pseudanabaena sp. FACHB-2040 TaxID=2692859 RepID=UPI001688A1CA|nr:DedA family protein [Pseudanabaena sp. FACHB-2040]MBD2260625.1 DedA family protein [Pseudanabaena sp. FACHB-2040]
MLDFVSLEVLQDLAHEYGYWAVFFGILLENAGIPIPGETITLIGGFLAGSGELKFWPVWATAISGAVVGDNLGYWIGAYGGWPLLQRLGKFFRIQETQLLAVKDQFSQNAARAVVLGRFVALLRIFAGPLAGIAQMPYPKFLLCNLLGATMWASVMVSLAYFVGQVIPLPTMVGWVAQFTVLALVLLVGWFVGTYWWEQRQQKLLVKELPGTEKVSH